MYLVFGAALGTLGGIFGIGGGLIAIPLLGVLCGLDQQIAQGTALVMVVPNVMLALWRYHQRNRIELRHALPLASMGFCFAWIGSIWAVGIDAQIMRIGFVAFLVALSAYNLVRMFTASAPASAQMNYSWPWLGVLGAASGTMGGLFGVGGAVGGYAGTDQSVRYHASGGAGLVAGAGIAKHRRHAGHLCRTPSGALDDWRATGARWPDEHQLGCEDRPCHARAVAARIVLRLPGVLRGDARL